MDKFEELFFRLLSLVLIAFSLVHFIWIFFELSWLRPILDGIWNLGEPKAWLKAFVGVGLMFIGTLIYALDKRR